MTTYGLGHLPHFPYTPLAVVSRARQTLRASTIATIAQILDVSSKEGTVIGAVISMPSIGQTSVLTSIGAVVEMGILSTLKRLLVESTLSIALVLTM
jgi:hypothetical protein